MIESLRTRAVQKVPDRVRFVGRVLLLTEDPTLLHRQLAGEDLPFDPLAPVGSPAHPKLRDNISTDEITPAYICYYFDETLGEFPYLGLKAGEEFPMVRGSVRAGGFVASAAGQRRGKGSSREAVAVRRDARGDPDRDRREHRAHLSRELPEPRRVHEHRLRAHRAHPQGRGDRARGADARRGRDLARDRRVRRAVQLQRRAAAGAASRFRW